MGQSASSQREREGFFRRDTRRFSRLIPDEEVRTVSRVGLDSLESGRTGQILPTSEQISTHQDLDSDPPFATFRREISAQSIPVRQSSVADGSATAHDEVLYEQEERPLVNMEDLGMRNAPITNITASPMPRQPSMMSRFGSRLLPRNLMSRVSSGGQVGRETEGVSLHRRLSDSQPSRPARTASTNARHRFSMFGSIPSELTNSSRSSTRRRLAPISRPIPLMVDGSLPPSGLTTSSLQSSGETPLVTSERRHSRFRPLSIRSSRLSRVRQSVATPFEQMFASNVENNINSREAQTPPQRPSRMSVADEADYLIPPLSTTDPRLELDSMEAHSLADQRSADMSSVTDPLPPDRSPSWTQRLVDRHPSVRRDARRVPNLLRGRSSRLIRRDDEAPLSRILQLAAAAIAAQLSGIPDHAMTNMQSVGNSVPEGGLHTLFQTLQDVTASNSNGQAADGANESTRPIATLPPLNFLRVFRFVNTSADDRSTTPTPRTANQAAPNDDGDDAPDGRTVTLVVVGVRSVPSGNLRREDVDGGEPSLDALLSLPVVPSNNMMRGGSGGLLRHADGRSRFTHRRRASMGGINTFPANYDSQRHQRTQGLSNPASVNASPNTATSMPLPLSESPPGPHPPPSTPADLSRSTEPSGTTTPNRRPSSASALQYSPLASNRDSALHNLHEADDLASIDRQPHQAVRQRRRSDSEFARHRDLGAGAARRNGVVEPDEATPQGRSWLIYVVGTNLSEDHPAFATPSLFTDVSTLSLRLHLEVSHILIFYSVEPHLRGHDFIIISPWTRKASGSKP